MEEETPHSKNWAEEVVKGENIHDRRRRTEELESANKEDAELDLPPQVLEQLAVVDTLVSLAGPDQPPARRLAALWILYQSSCRSNKNPSGLKAAVTLGVMEKLKDVYNPSFNGLPLYRRTESVLLFMAVVLLSRMSQLPIRFPQEIISPPLLMQMMTIADFNGKYFIYPREAATYLKELNSRVPHLMTQVVEKELDSDYLESIHEEVGDLLAPTTLIGDRVKICDFCNPDDLSWDARDELIAKKLAWPRLPSIDKTSGGGQTERSLFSRDLPWHPILITSAINGRWFWAQVGMDTFKQLGLLYEKLREVDKQPLESASEAGPGQLVLAVSETPACPLVRAQVMDHREGQVVIFAVDLGYVRTIDPSKVFTVPPFLSLSQIPPLASLCCLPDVQPPPVDAVMLQLALNVVSNLCRAGKEVSTMLYHLGVLPRALGLLEAPESTVAAQAARVLQNMTRGSYEDDHFLCLTLIDRCLGILESIPELGLPKMRRESIEASLLSTIGNIVIRNKEYKTYFSKANGLEIVMKSLRGKHVSAVSCTAAVQVFRNMINDADVFGSPPKSALGMLPREEQSACQGGACAEPELVPPDAQSLQPAGEVCPDWIQQAVHQADFPPERPDIASIKMVKGEDFPYEDSCIVSTCPEPWVSDVSRAFIAKTVCSMLNTGLGGMVFFGIKEGKVEGVFMRREQRDQFRLGVDVMFKSDIDPDVLHVDFDVHYLPLYHVQHERTRALTEARGTYIVVLLLNPNSSGTVYTCRGGACFYRVGDKALRISEQEVRNLVGVLGERKYQREIQELRAKLDALKKATLSRQQH